MRSELFKDRPRHGPCRARVRRKAHAVAPGDSEVASFEGFVVGGLHRHQQHVGIGGVDAGGVPAVVGIRRVQGDIPVFRATAATQSRQSGKVHFQQPLYT